MEVSIRQAAAFAGRSPRTIRQWIAASKLPARRKGRQWVVRIEDLPLTDGQRERLANRAEEARAVVDACVPSRIGVDRSRTRRSLLDLEVFRALELLAARLVAVAAARGISSSHALAAAIRGLEVASERLASGLQEFDGRRRERRLASIKLRLGRVVAELWRAPEHDDDAVLAAITELEQRALPMLGGLARQALRPAGHEARGNARRRTPWR